MNNNNQKKLIKSDIEIKSSKNNSDVKIYREILFENRFLKAFFEYLNNNKIEYKIEEVIKEEFLVVEIKTLEPKFFMMILNKEHLKNFQIKYDHIRYFRKKYGNKGKTNKKLYILFLKNSIKSQNEVLYGSNFVDLDKISFKEQIDRIKKKDVSFSLKEKAKNGLPLGIYNENNKLNDLTGKEWIKFTKSWFIHNPPSRNNLEILHPAKFPESLIEEFIKFFTKKYQIVFDPFLGTGSTAVAAKNTFRKCIGIEIIKKYYEISLMRLAQKTLDRWVETEEEYPEIKIFNEDSNNIEKIWKKNKLPKVDFCITSPPYWNQLKRNSMRQKERKVLGLDTQYSKNPNDIGNIDDYNEFINIQKRIFNQVYKILKNKGYLVIITNNVFYNGKVFPLVYSTAISLSDKWILKDEKIWCQDDKALLPLGINNAWVANRCHQYCLIFRKENN